LKSASLKLSNVLTKSPSPDPLSTLDVPRCRPEDLHKSRRSPQQNSYNRNPALVKVPVHPTPHQPSDHASSRQRNRQLNHRLGLHQLPERTLPSARAIPAVS
jgi:hypothetical protein